MSLVRKIKSITNSVGEGVSSAATAVSNAASKTRSSSSSSSSSYQMTPEKKGEINELRAALSDPSIDRDDARKREVLTRVIGYMTMGLDTSKLFHNMIMVRVLCFVFCII